MLWKKHSNAREVHEEDIAVCLRMVCSVCCLHLGLWTTESLKKNCMHCCCREHQHA